MAHNAIPWYFTHRRGNSSEVTERKLEAGEGADTCQQVGRSLPVTGGQLGRALVAMHK